MGLGETRLGAGKLDLALRRLRQLFRPRVEVTKPPANIRVDRDVPVKMRDGVTLRVNLHRPEGEGPLPVILSAHPYGKDKTPARSRSGRGLHFQYHLFPQPDVISISDLTSWEAPDPAVWVPLGYAVVNADMRGGGRSEGTGELFSDAEAQDYFELIEWAGTQPWSNGRVGLDGVSYLAISQYKVAALAPPHLAAICPWEGFTDLYRDFARPGGIREDGFSIIWSRATNHAARMQTRLRPEIVARKERDDWWRARTPSLERIRVPMLVCASFSDHSLHSRGSFEAFSRAGSERKWLYTHRSGKWSSYYGKEATATRIRFFDHFLKGVDDGWADEPAARLAIYDQGPDPVAITHERQWPPDDLEWRKIWLDAGSGCIREAPPTQPSSTAFSTPDGGVSFTWEVFEDIDVVGPMALRLFIELQGADDASLFVGIRKFRAGAELTFEGSFGFSGDMVSKGWLRAAHRALDPELSIPAQPVHTHEKAEPLSLGEIAAIDVALLPHATRFLKGDQLRIDIRGRWPYPRNPFFGQFPNGYQKSPKAACVIHSGRGREGFLYFGSRTSAATSAKKSLR